MLLASILPNGKLDVIIQALYMREKVHPLRSLDWAFIKLHFGAIFNFQNLRVTYHAPAYRGLLCAAMR